MANLAINGQNTGKDVSINFLTNTGISVTAAQLGIMTDFDCKSEDVEITTRSIIQDGATFIEILPKEVTATFKFKRYNGGMTDMVLAYRAAKKAGTLFYFTVSWNVKNPDGTIDTYTLSQGKPLNPNFGNFIADQAVTQDFTMKFTDIQKTGGGTNLFGVF